MSKLKVMTILGTRPEIIRLSRTMSLLDKYLDQVIVHTGQNYDYELNEVFWEDLELRKPDIFLEASRSCLEEAVGDIICKSGEVMREEQPDAVLVLGDTNSCLGAYMAKRLHIPIFHMEAGNRCFDQNVPEETNRKIIDHIADYNLVYTEHARRHLLSEGLPHRRIYLTGSPMREVLNYYERKIKDSNILEELGLDEKEYFLISTHREENVDNEENLQKIILALNKLAKKYNYPIVVSTHPRTRNRLEDLKNAKIHDLINFMKPFGFLDYVYLQKKATCVISDSGTISEESSILTFPAISLRESMERPEAQDAGSITLTGFDKDVIINSVKVAIEHYKANAGSRNTPDDYQISNTSWRVLKLILGNTKLSNKWAGIRK